MPPATPPAAPAPGDRTPPSLRVQSPANTSVVTTASTITLRGSASDNAGVVRVVWTSSVAGSGTAAGTTNWVAESIPLYVGTNYIVVRAFDAAGNSSWRSLVVTRK
jgi:hypothetical protein